MNKKLVLAFLGFAVCGSALKAQTLETAILSAVAKISRDLPAGVTVAVINFSSDSEKLNEHVLNELYGAILRNRRVTPVQSNQRQFQNIQDELRSYMEGEMDRESARSIGRLMGAQYLVTGSLERIGSEYRIQFTAVDMDAQPQSEYSASLNYRTDRQFASLLAVRPSTSAASGSASASQQKPIDIAAIAGVAAPATGKTPVTKITETAQYSGTVAWSPEVSGTFAVDTRYTATITLTAKTGLTFQGVKANFFTVEGSESASNDANSGVVTAVFPATVKAVISIDAITGVKAPVTGKTPVTEITENAQYSGTVTWSPDVSGTFEPLTQYTATITLAPKTGYTLEGVEADFFKVARSATANDANSGVVKATFPPDYPEDAELWTVGVSVGTSFSAPLIIGTVRGTLAPFRISFIERGTLVPFRGSFIEMGMDVGLGINQEDVQYFSLYPFANYALFMPFARSASGKKGGWYAGAGLGVMFANYTFEIEGPVWDTAFAVNIVTGFYLFDMFDVSYTLRTNFKSAGGKLSVGYVHRFK